MKWGSRPFSEHDETKGNQRICIMEGGGGGGVHFLETTWNIFHLENIFLSCGNWQWSVRDSIHAFLSFVGANTTNYNCKGKWNKWNVMAFHCSYLSDIIWLCSFIIVIKQVFLPTSLCRHWNKQEYVQRSALTAVHLMSIRFTNHSDGDWIIYIWHYFGKWTGYWIGDTDFRFAKYSATQGCVVFKTDPFLISINCVKLSNTMNI